MKVNGIAIKLFIFPLWYLLSIPNSLADLATINITIKATLTASACTVSSGSQEMTVIMGNWSQNLFAKPGGVPPKPFSINLNDCSTTSGVAVTFRGESDKSDPSLLAISGGGAAKNVGIAILDKNRNRIPLGQSSVIYNLTPGADSAELEFYGQYIATGEVSAGAANADATFTIEYP